ncbi:hypothetical protein BSL78_12406 [Apostichopus japonicus]|uniref:Uncharacterized protein n=1 Tax=Stichopus japonicus TaxID=307972 RepID=A0A2G8KS04_STIJA|nr:hypothetical protein BSL78_12406 [Apostichopus japonicus]
MNSLSLKENRNLLGRMLIIAQVGDLDIRNVLTYSLGPVPTAFANFDATMRKTNKAVMTQILERKFPDAVVDLTLEGETAVVVDAMAMIQIQRNLPATFGEFASGILGQLISLGSKYSASTVEFAIDRYRDMSIKNAERTRRVTSGTYDEMRITRAGMKMPRQFKKFLASGKNKEALLSFLVESWKEYSPHRLKGLNLYASSGDDCYKLQSVNDSMVTTEIAELHCDHEEADTHVFLHAQYAPINDKAVNVIIRSPDTDVLVIGVSCVHRLQCQLFLHLTGRNTRILHVNRIADSLGEKATQALIGLQVISGCDTVSAFQGKGKKKLVNILLSSESHMTTFSLLGTEWTVYL